jgi:AcrR family transcriptional regulator
LALKHFLKLTPEKQETIIQAALDEFIEYGYDMASTNRIVERAGIAKGTLFKYFSSKEDLFVYLFDTIAAQIRPSVYLTEQEEPSDLFDALKIITMRKATIRYRYPREYALLLQIMTNTNHPVYRKILEKITAQSFDYFGRLSQKIDFSNLQPGVSSEEAFQLVSWTIRGMEYYILEQSNVVGYSEEYEKSLFEKFDRMCELLKYGLYNSPPSPQVAEPFPTTGESAPLERVAVPPREQVRILTSL